MNQRTSRLLVVWMVFCALWLSALLIYEAMIRPAPPFTLIASLLQALPLVVTTPLVPDFAFLTLLSWRLLRPEMWPAFHALPLGLFDDLVAGHPLGQSMALWTMVTRSRGTARFSRSRRGGSAVVTCLISRLRSFSSNAGRKANNS